MAFTTRETPFAVVWGDFFFRQSTVWPIFRGLGGSSWVWISPPNKTPGNGMDGYIYIYFFFPSNKIRDLHIGLK